MGKVLILSDSPALNSGQARVVRELAIRFHKIGEVVVGGWHHELVEDIENKFPYPIFSVDKEKPQEKSQVLQALKRERPDCLLAFGDLHNFQFLPNLFSEYGEPIKLVYYLNIDGDVLAATTHFLKHLYCADHIITTSKFGLNQLQRLDNSLSLSYVYHGVDSECFKRSDAISILEGGLPVDDKFIVFCNSQNTSRKNLPAAIYAFDLFAKAIEDKDIRLYLLTNPLDPLGNNLIELVKELGLQNKVLFYKSSPLKASITDKELNGLYNAASCFLYPSTGEGGALTILEALAAECFPIALNYSSMPEFLEDEKGYLVDYGVVVRGTYNVGRAIADPIKLADALSETYNMWKDKMLPFMTTRGRQFVKPLSWDKCFEGINTVIENVLSDTKKTVFISKSKKDYLFRAETNRLLQRLGLFKDNTIGIIKMGGLGDNIQALPIIDAISIKYPNHNLIVYCETNKDVFMSNHQVKWVVELGHEMQIEVVSSVADLYFEFFDLRYVSRNLHGPDADFFQAHRRFYDYWPESNIYLSSLDLHVIDIMLLSLGLKKSDRKNVKDKSILTPYNPYIVFHSYPGMLGKMKMIPFSWAEYLVDIVRSLGLSVIQVGGGQEANIRGCLDYRGKTSYEQLVYLLKHSLGYFGLEGGIYHLAEYLNKPSLVWFACTPVECFAYPTSVVLYTGKCTPCWWSTPYLENICLRGEQICLNIPDLKKMREMTVLWLDSIKEI